MIKIDLIGQTFGRLTVIAQLPSKNYGRWTVSMWLCQCECGNKTSVTGNRLKAGRSKSCGCYKQDIQRGRPYGWLYTKLRHNAKNSKRSCELTYEEFLQFTTIIQCHYCGATINWIPHHHNESGCYFLDRKDNTAGYIKENCVVCCSLCNLIKGKTLSYEEMRLLENGLRQIQELRVLTIP